MTLEVIYAEIAATAILILGTIEWLDQNQCLPLKVNIHVDYLNNALIQVLTSFTPFCMHLYNSFCLVYCDPSKNL